MNKLKMRIKNLTKCQKIILIGILVALVLVIAAACYLVFIKKDKTSDKQEAPKESIVVVKDNYKYVDGVLNFLNEEDQEIGTYECVNKDQNLCYVSYETPEEAFDETESVYEDGTLIKTRSKIYFEQYAFVNDGESGELILYDFKNNTEVGKYLEVKTYYDATLNYKENNYVILKNLENKYGVYDLDATTPKEIISAKYDYLGVIKNKMTTKNNRLVYRLGEDRGLLTFKNKSLITLKEPIKGYNAKYLKTVNSSNLYNLINYEGNPVLEGFNYIDVMEDYIVTISENKYLNVLNNDLVKMMAQKLTINNDYFTKIKVYDANNNLVKTNQSYELAIMGDVLYVNIYDEEEKTENTYDILAAKLSASYDYFSYEDGKLYIFSDLEKTKLSGIYPCENKNAITETSTEFTSCFIARDGSNPATLSTPIYNNRFVFVNDAPVLVNDTTVKTKLYDLKLKKLLGNYTNVFTYSKVSDTKKNIYIETEMPKYVIAVNKNGKYGMLKLEETEASKAINFEYDDIRIQDNFLIGKTGSKWALINYDGTKVLDGEYVLFEIYPTYVATIDETNKLLLHDYDKKVLIKTPVQLTSATETYKISMKANNYIIETTTGTYTYDGTTGELVPKEPVVPVVPEEPGEQDGTE